MPDRARDVREFWFGRVPLDAARLAERMDFWFGANEPPAVRRERDDAMRERFEPLVADAARGKLAAWAVSPRRSLALVLLLDQLPRNLYRGTPRAFATDRQALALTLAGIQSGADAALAAAERIFFYMPLQHSESAEAQDESVAAYRRLLDESAEALRPQLSVTLESAERHRSIIERFGRFPHRNRILGRPTTPEEEAFLAAGADSFGQD
ncbi:MAG: DUF924 family protein [Steroidobacteraceae bacterium]